MNLLIEENDHGGVTITTDDETLDVARANLLIDLAKLSLLSSYIGENVLEHELMEDELGELE